MTVATEAWRARIGCFQHSRPLHRPKMSRSTILPHSSLICILLLIFWFLKTLSTPHHCYGNRYQTLLVSSIQVLSRILILLLLLCAGNIHPNPGPISFNFMDYNVNSLKAHKFSRVRLIESFINIHSLHLAAITESALETSTEEELIKIEGFDVIRKELTSNSTMGVLVYIKNNIAYKHRSDL